MPDHPQTAMSARLEKFTMGLVTLQFEGGAGISDSPGFDATSRVNKTRHSPPSPRRGKFMCTAQKKCLSRSGKAIAAIWGAPYFLPAQLTEREEALKIA